MMRHLFSGNKAGGSIAVFTPTSEDEAILECRVQSVVQSDAENPCSISLAIDVNQIDPSPVDTDSFLQVNLSWGSARAGVQSALLDCSQGCRVTVEAATFLIAKAHYEKGPAKKGPRYAIRATASLGRSGIILPNTCSALPFTIAPGGGNGGKIPAYAKTVRIYTNTQNSFPPVRQGSLGLARSIANLPNTDLQVGFDNGIEIPIPAGMEGFIVGNNTGADLLVTPSFGLILG